MGQAKEDEYIVSTTFTPSSLAGNKLLTANVKVENINAPNDSVLAIVSLYDSNDRMINMSYISRLLQRTIETLTAGFILPADITGHCVKVFVWDGRNHRKIRNAAIIKCCFTMCYQ